MNTIKLPPGIDKFFDLFYESFLTQAKREFCANRLFEWVMTIAIIGLGVQLMFSPNKVTEGAFEVIQMTIDRSSLSFFFLLVGAGRVAALFANGHWPVYGPRIRAFGALAGAVIWFQLGLALFVAHAPLPGGDVYFALMVGEIIAMYRAATDVRISHK